VIEAVGPARTTPIPAGHEVIDCGARWVAPGFVDLHCHIAAGSALGDINDTVYMTNPELHASAAVVPDNDALKLAVAGGVTSVLFIPGSGSNMGGQGILLKTGMPTFEEMRIRDPGSLKLAQAGILPLSLTILSLETSTPRGTAEIGRGPIVRVGDRISSFDGSATARLLSTAQEEEIPVQRCLLDGGTCEATAYQLYGYTCAAASLALGNYHNVTPEGTIAPEYVAIDDLVGMVRLCVATVLRGKAHEPQRALRKKLEENARSYREFYSTSRSKPMRPTRST